MVRPKMQLEKLNGELSREQYYLQNKSIVEKKVEEMSVLTGTDVFFLGFSPTGIPSLHVGKNSNFVNIMRRFSMIPYGDREKRRLDNLQTIKSTYQKEGYNVDVQTLSQAWKVKTVEDLGQKLIEKKKKLADLKLRKSYWENPKTVNSIEKIMEMEQSLQKTLDDIRQRKRELHEQQLMISQTAAEPFEFKNDDLVHALINIIVRFNNMRSILKTL